MSTQVESLTSALTLVEAQPIEALFKPEAINPILAKIAVEVRAPKFDITKDVDRKLCASLAFKLAKTRTFIDSCRLKLVAAEKQRLKAIDKEGARIWDELETLQSEVRKPLTDWEDAEKARIARHEEHIRQLEQYPNFFVSPSTCDIRKRLAALEREDLSDMREFTERARTAQGVSLRSLRENLAASEKADADRAELGRLRQEQEVRTQKEREQAIAAKAKVDAEAVAEKKIQEAQAAKAKAEQMAADLIEAQARHTEAAKVRAKQEQDAAVQREKDRQVAQKKAEAEAEAKREANKKHCAKINRGALDAFIARGIEEEIGKLVIELIAKGQIPNIKITY